VRLLATSPGAYVAVHADLGSLDEVRDLSSQVQNLAPDGLDLLINNAGAQFDERWLTSDKIEMTTAIVHLAAAALTRLLLDHLRRGRLSAQVINVTSLNERFGKPVEDRSYATGYGQTQAWPGVSTPRKSPSTPRTPASSSPTSGARPAVPPRGWTACSAPWRLFCWQAPRRRPGEACCWPPPRCRPDRRSLRQGRPGRLVEALPRSFRDRPCTP